MSALRRRISLNRATQRRGYGFPTSVSHATGNVPMGQPIGAGLPPAQRTGGTLGGAFQSAGYSPQMSTPSLGDASALNAPDIGEVTTEPARSVSLSALEGPWIVLADGLQGELYIHDNGFAFFRPGDRLGQGIGKVELVPTSVGIMTLKFELEIYRYDNVAKDPPATPERFSVVALVNTARASKHNYETLLLAGQLMQDGRTRGAFNAAKMMPWEKQPFWAPNALLAQGFQQVFQHVPLNPRSHLQRRLEGGNQPLLSERFRVGPISNVYYIPNYVSEAEEAEMLRHVAATPKEFRSKLEKRTVQEWGCSMCETCNSSFVSDANQPPWTQAACNMLLQDRVFSPSMFPNNVRIHEYEVGEGIAPHVDGPIYIPRVAIISLQAPVVMAFYPRRAPYDSPMEHYNDTFRFDGDITKDVPVMSLVLEPRSLLVFEGDAYSLHPHGISDKAVDSLAPSVAGPIVNRHLLSDGLRSATEVVRSLRVGVTIRNLLPRCNHQPMRAEYSMMNAWQHYHHQVDSVLGFAVPSQHQLPPPAGHLHPHLAPRHEAPRPVAATASHSPSRELHQPNTTFAGSGVGSSSHPSHPVHHPTSNGGGPDLHSAGQSSRPMYGYQPAGVRAAPSPSPQSRQIEPAVSDVSQQSVARLERKVDELLASHAKLQTTMSEVLQVVAHTTAKNAAFERETAGILNHMSSLVLQVQSDVEDVLAGQSSALAAVAEQATAAAPTPARPDQAT